MDAIRHQRQATRMTHKCSLLPPFRCLPVGTGRCTLQRHRSIPTFRWSARVEKVNVAEKFSLFSEHWSPRIVGELNGQQVKLAKLLGSFDWHHHEHEDELFLVVQGSLTMRLRDREVQLNEGEFFVVPRGVEHQPVAEQEAHVLLFEPASTLNTGNLHNERTRTNLPRL